MRAWIVDLDGTLALGHFGEPGRRGPFNWDRVGEDDVNKPVLTLVRALAADRKVLIVSGRDESCLAQTLDWLNRHKVPWDMLFMRAERDYRPDTEVKLEIWHTRIRDHYDVEGVLDDRDGVVAMWRELGLMCAQVAPGDF